jgi:acetoin utilization deacetylase AcuC-like enzyme
VGRLRAIHRAVGLDQTLFHQVQHHEARHALEDELSLCHGIAHIRRVREMALQGGGQMDADTVVSPGSWAAATAAAGAVLDAVDMAVRGTAARSFCAVRPPGHHALASNGMGFCLFGNVALGAHYARRRHGLERILIVDWDVHHGNGTQDLVEAEADIHFVSMHQWPWYPGTGGAAERGCGNVWNVPMAAGLEAARYVDALRTAIDSATVGFVPDLVLISSGFDSMLGDPLGGFTWREAHFVVLTRELCERADGWCGGRVVSSLEGGYNTQSLGGVATAHMRALAGLPDATDVKAG